jgi:hypothetical protein
LLCWAQQALLFHPALDFCEQDTSPDIMSCLASSRHVNVPLEMGTKVVAPMKGFGCVAEFTAPHLRIVGMSSIAVSQPLNIAFAVDEGYCLLIVMSL